MAAVLRRSRWPRAAEAAAGRGLCSLAAPAHGGRPEGPPPLAAARPRWPGPSPANLLARGLWPRAHGFATLGGPELHDLLASLRGSPDEAALARFEAAGPSIQQALIKAPMAERVSVLRSLAQLGSLPGKPFPVGSYFFIFLEDYTAELEVLRDGETIAQRAMELREILRCFHRAGIGTERLRILYSHVEQDFPRFEAVGALLPMAEAVRLCHTMLATGQSAAPAVVVLLRSALREPLVHVADDSNELRHLKTIEMLVRLDFLHTQEQLPRDVVEYLSVVRSLRYYDRELRRETPLSYQLSFFLRKHGFPAKRHMLGPYPLKVCDPDERINFEPVEERAFRHGMPEEPPARKRRHLESVGWRSIEVHAKHWEELATYEAKAAYVRSILKEQDLIER